MSKVIEEAADLLKGRLSELDDERGKIERSLAELPLNGNGPTATPAPRRSPGRPKGSRKAASKKIPAATRAKRAGGRADQAVALITRRPGISASDIAKEMKIKPNYLYRVLGDLESAGRVVKDGRSYSPPKS